VNKITSGINLLFTRRGFNLVNKKNRVRKMAFTLEADFVGRPTRVAPESQSQPSAKDRKGADFKESLSNLDVARHRDDEPENLDSRETGQTAVAAILINDPPRPPSRNVSLGDTLPVISTGDLTSDAGVEISEALNVEETMRSSLSIAADDIQATPLPVDTASIATVPAASSDLTSKEPAQPARPEGAMLEPALPNKDNVPPRSSDPAGFPADTAPDPEVQSILASAAAPVSANTGSIVKSDSADAKVPSSSALATPLSQPVVQASSGGASGSGQRSGERAASDAPSIDRELTVSTSQNAGATSFSEIVVADKSAASQDGNLAAQPMMQQTQAPQPATVPMPNGLTQTNALISATPAQVVDVISDSLTSPEDRKNRIVVQLDPPELGRVSIDYKFDSHGLQHVTITGESPEAMRQLRLMHFELVNALEKQGLSSQNMSFQQQQAQQDPSQQAPRTNRLEADMTGNRELTVPALIASQISQPGSTSSGGLNIKL
jgi:hypothetical protein